MAKLDTVQHLTATGSSCCSPPKHLFVLNQPEYSKVLLVVETCWRNKWAATPPTPGAAAGAVTNL